MSEAWTSHAATANLSTFIVLLAEMLEAGWSKGNCAAAVNRNYLLDGQI